MVWSCVQDNIFLCSILITFLTTFQTEKCIPNICLIMRLGRECECVSFCKLNVPIWVRMCLRVCKRACKATVLSPKSCFTWHRQSCNAVGNVKIKNCKSLEMENLKIATTWACKNRPANASKVLFQLMQKSKMQQRQKCYDIILPVAAPPPKHFFRI